MHKAPEYQVFLPTQPDQEEAYENRILFDDRHDRGFFHKTFTGKAF